MYSYFFTLVWMSAFLYSFVHSEISGAKLSVNSAVFVALRGEDLTVTLTISKPANASQNNMTCYDPFVREIHRSGFPEKDGHGQIFERKIELKSLSVSGEFHCQYETAKAFWFVLVRDKGYKGTMMSEMTEFITLSIITSLLLIFSVLGSLYVFRGNWKEQLTVNQITGGKQYKNGEERKQRETEEDSEENNKNPSTSHYASLQARPRSIYDVLDHSGRNKEQDQIPTKPEKTETQNPMQQNTIVEDKEEIESVYENFKS